MAEYLAEDGTIITEAMIDSWVEEIEGGFPNSIIEPMSDEDKRKRDGVIAMSGHTIRFSDALWSLGVQEAQANGQSMSAFMRDALVEKILKNKHEREQTGV